MKLRYAAYEAPQPHSRLRHHVNSRQNAASSRLVSGWDLGKASSSLNSSANDSGTSLNALAKTVTAGDLTLAAGEYELDDLRQVISFNR